MSSDWWAKKLGGNAAPSTYTPTTPPPSSYPGGPAVPQYIPPVPQGQAPQVTKDNFAQVAGLWKGGEASRKETSRCPHCGGDHFFSMANAGGSQIATTRGMVSAAPRCADCGYTTRHGMQTGAM